MLVARAVRYLFRGPVGNLCSRSVAVPGAGVERPRLALASKETLVIPGFQDSYVLRQPQPPLPPLFVGRGLGRAAYGESDAGCAGCSLPLPRPQLEDD
jgi:hypothetical protein